MLGVFSTPALEEQSVSKVHPENTFFQRKSYLDKGVVYTLKLEVKAVTAGGFRHLYESELYEARNRTVSYCYILICAKVSRLRVAEVAAEDFQSVSASTIASTEPSRSSR